MRGCLSSLGCMGLLLAYAACGTGIMAGFYHALHGGPGSERLLTILPFDTYALEGELHRCRDLGVAAYNDIRCEVAWKEERVRVEACPQPDATRAAGEH